MIYTGFTVYVHVYLDGMTKRQPQFLQEKTFCRCSHGCAKFGFC
jgi:hypothetical protein